jgi:hypothetical protein
MAALLFYLGDLLFFAEETSTDEQEELAPEVSLGAERD